VLIHSPPGKSTEASPAEFIASNNAEINNSMLTQYFLALLLSIGERSIYNVWIFSKFCVGRDRLWRVSKDRRCRQNHACLLTGLRAIVSGEENSRMEENLVDY
jgi:hypothetical protein